MALRGWASTASPWGSRTSPPRCRPPCTATSRRSRPCPPRDGARARVPFHQHGPDLQAAQAIPGELRPRHRHPAHHAARPGGGAARSSFPGSRRGKKYIDGDLPSPETKLRLFCIAREKFLTAGYAAIGMDHFALPGDELARAVEPHPAPELHGLHREDGRRHGGPGGLRHRRRGQELRPEREEARSTTTPWKTGASPSSAATPWTTTTSCAGT